MYDSLSDYSREPVPRQSRRGVIWIAATSSAWLVAVTTLFTGGALAADLDITEITVAILIGMGIIAIVGYGMGRLGATFHVSTTMLARNTFGTFGAAILGVILALTLGIGWFAWQLSFFATTLSEILPAAAWAKPPYSIAWAGILMTMTALGGFRSLAWLSIVAVPLVLAVAGFGIYLALGSSDPALASSVATKAGSLTMMTGITAVVGSAIFGAVVVADISRYSRDAKSGALAVALGYAGGGTVVMIAGAIMAEYANVPGVSVTANVPAAMNALGMGYWAFIVLLLAQWTTNDSNLYSGSLGLAGVLPFPKPYLVLSMGTLGIAIASIGIENFFVPYLVFLGTFMPPVAGVIIVDYYIFRMRGKQTLELDMFERAKPVHWLACLSVVLGGITAQQLAQLGSIFGAASVISFIFSGVYYFLPKFLLLSKQTASIR